MKRMTSAISLLAVVLGLGVSLTSRGGRGGSTRPEAAELGAGAMRTAEIFGRKSASGGSDRPVYGRSGRTPCSLTCASTSSFLGAWGCIKALEYERCRSSPHLPILSLS